MRITNCAIIVICDWEVLCLSLPVIKIRHFRSFFKPFFYFQQIPHEKCAFMTFHYSKCSILFKLVRSNPVFWSFSVSHMTVSTASRRWRRLYSH